MYHELRIGINRNFKISKFPNSMRVGGVKLCQFGLMYHSASQVLHFNLPIFFVYIIPRNYQITFFSKGTRPQDYITKTILSPNLNPPLEDLCPKLLSSYWCFAAWFCRGRLRPLGMSWISGAVLGPPLLPLLKKDTSAHYPGSEILIGMGLVGVVGEDGGRHPHPLPSLHSPPRQE